MHSMKNNHAFSSLLLTLALFATTSVANTIPKAWIDETTGHRVVRLSEEPGSRSLYFHQNGYSAEGDKMVISVDNPRGIATVDLTTFEVRRLYEHPDVGLLFMGPKSRNVYVTQIEGVGSGKVVAKTNCSNLPKYLRLILIPVMRSTLLLCLGGKFTQSMPMKLCL